MMARKRLAIAGSLAQRPGRGGHAWVFLQYLLGFRRLGWDVLFLDEIQPDACRDEQGQPCSFERSVNVRTFVDLMGQFGLEGCYSVSYSRCEQTVGMPRYE